MIERINIEPIKLDNVQVKFQVKLLQSNINTILYKYRNKYRLKPYLSNLVEEITQTVIKANITQDKDSEELITKAREIIKNVKQINTNNTKEDTQLAIDNTSKFILYNFTQNKENITVEQAVEIIKEINIINSIITEYHIDLTPRFKNLFKLKEQLIQFINEKLK